MNILLQGVVGSTAYGLAHEGSDVDRLGMFAVNTADLHGLRNPGESVVTKDPDLTLHEARKWCRLALSGNPTVMELLWLPDDLYEERTPLGDELIGMRTAFLSASRVRDAYLGYATQQFRRLESRADGTFGPDLAKRTAKHARHMYRLLIQGYGLWRTGSLMIEVPKADVVWGFGELVAAGDLSAAQQLLQLYEVRFDGYDTKLPDVPDTARVEAWLLKVRREFYTGRSQP